MSSIHYLNANEFGQENGHLVANVGGITFVMFHSNNCTHCMNFLPEFKQLPAMIRGVNFGLCNVDGANRQIVQMSKQSSTPITAVPKFILYNDGLPYVEYSGQRSRQAVLGFLQDIIGKLNQKQTFTRPRRTRQQQPPMQQPVGGMPQAPQGPPQQQPQQQQQNPNYVVSPTTGVKEYETSYGRPYNTLNEQEFLAYESAYKQNKH